ncbi:hypothetical protein ABIB57_004447 [Devosia sp. UYZn731]
MDKTTELQPLWDLRYVMGNKSKTCITSLGQRFVRAFDTAQRH